MTQKDDNLSIAESVGRPSRCGLCELPQISQPVSEIVLGDDNLQDLCLSQEVEDTLDRLEAYDLVSRRINSPLLTYKIAR